MNILIKNIDMITCDPEAGVIKNGNIGIRDNRVAFVNAQDEQLRSFKADRIIYGKHRLALPGLVNAHTHCAMTLLRNSADDLDLQEWLFKKILPVEELMTEDDIYWGTMLGIAEMLKSGTTLFADMYLHMDQVARAVEETGIKANLSRSPASIHKNESDDCVIGDEAWGCYDYYNKWNRSADGRIKVYVEIHSTYLYEENSLRNAAKMAKSCGTGIHIHINETAAEYDLSMKKYGMNSIEVCREYGIFDVPVIAAHCVHMSDNDIKVVKDMNVNVVHNPTSNLKLGSGIARISDMLENGVSVSLGTDGAASNNNLNMFEEMHIAALMHKGVSRNPQLLAAPQILDMATSKGAQALGFGSETGCIRAGMKADLILLDTDKPHFYPVNNAVSAVVYSAQGSDVDTVIVDGRILMEGRSLKSIDEELVKHKVNEIARRLSKG